MEIRRTHGSYSNSEFEGLCVIKNFRDDVYYAGDYKVSASFSTGLDHIMHESNLAVFADGYDDEYLDYVSIEFDPLRECGTDESPLNRLRFTASIIDKNGKKYLTKATYYESEIDVAVLRDFVLRDDLLSDAKLLPDGELRIAFKISCNASNGDKAIKPSQINQLELLGKVFDAGNYADFEFIVEGKKFKVHRAILAARSPVFKAMFDSQMRESNEGKAEIMDVEARVMEKLLRFAYVGNVADFEDVAGKILVVAEKYQIDDLKQLCEDVLFEQLSVSNVYDILRLADENTAENLKKNTIEFFHHNAKELSADVNFKAQLNSLSGHLKTDMICAAIDMDKI